MKIVTLRGVYPPSEDTFFLASWLDGLNLRGLRLLDIGSGTGYLSVLGALKGALVTASDRDPKAVLNTRLNARLNGVRVRTVLSDLFESVRGRYDVIVFNPPYLTPWPEAPSLAWDGGWRIVKRFLEEVEGHLEKGGCFGLVMEEDDNWRKIERMLSGVRVERNTFHLIRVIGCP